MIPCVDNAAANMFSWYYEPGVSTTLLGSAYALVLSRLFGSVSRQKRREVAVEGNYQCLLLCGY